MRMLQALLTATLTLSLTGCIFLSEETPPHGSSALDAAPDLIDATPDAPSQLIDTPPEAPDEAPDAIDEAPDAIDDSPPEMPCALEATEQEYCASEGAQCGELTVRDSCGAQVTISCGECDSGTCTDNRCDGCVPEDDATLCAINGSCGVLIVADRCGEDRRIDCSTIGCQGEGTSCDPLSGQCSCAGEQACPQGRTCGDFVNACGQQVACGTCDGDERCEEDSGTCFCPIPTCPTTAECGSVTNSCGKTRTCGEACPGLGESCDPDQLQCVCDNTLSDSQLCARSGRECGMTTVDLCGESKPISCGGCSNPLFQVCNPMGRCVGRLSP